MVVVMEVVAVVGLGVVVGASGWRHSKDAQHKKWKNTNE